MRSHNEDLANLLGHSCGYGISVDNRWGPLLPNVSASGFLIGRFTLRVGIQRVRYLGKTSEDPTKFRNFSIALAPMYK